MSELSDFDAIVNNPRFQPYWGWHDDHRDHDRTADYRPASQQNRAEFHQFMSTLVFRGMRTHWHKCLQLGFGIPGATHWLFESMFRQVWSVDRSFDGPATNDLFRIIGGYRGFIHGDTHDPYTYARVARIVGDDLDLLFIDAGHLLDDIEQDYATYWSLVRPGGIIAFHDAVKRPTYEEEIQVWRFIEKLHAQGIKTETIGTEIGIAWLVKT